MGPVRRAVRLALSVLAVAGTSPAALAGAALPTRMTCAAFAIAPDAQVAPGLICVHVVTTLSPLGEETARTVEVFVSHDGGRRWIRRGGVGLPGVPEIDVPPRNPAGYVGQLGSTPTSAFYSGGYLTNNTIYLAIAGEGAGLYETTDDGNTWRLAAAVPDSLSATYAPYVDKRPEPGGQAMLQAPIAIGGDGTVNPLRVDAPLITREAGASPAASRQFLFSSRPYRGVILMDYAEQQEDVGPAFSHDVASLRSCNLDLSCDTVLHSFPAGGFLTSVVLAGDYARTGQVLVSEYATEGAPSRSLGWLESTDGGRHFHAWRHAPRQLRERDKECAALTSSVASNPHRPGYLAVLVESNQCTPSRSGVYISRDDGRHWQRTFGGASDPWGSPAFSATLQMGPTGRLYALVNQSHYTWRDPAFLTSYTLWCSVDLGKTWRSPCAD